MESFGDNLSRYQNLEVVSSTDPEELRDMLKSLKLPFTIISMYSTGSRHYAWINSSHKIKKVSSGSKAKPKRQGVQQV